MTASTSSHLRELRELAELSQEELAAFLELSEQTIADWEAGAAIPPKHQRDLALLAANQADTNASLARYGGGGGDPERALYGSAKIAFPAHVPNPEGSGGESASKQQWREYPISEAERTRIYERLQQDGPDWLGFRTLDQRAVLVNRSALSSFALTGDDVTGSPPYFSAAIYEALAEPELRQILESEVDYDGSDEDALFSSRFVSDCAAAVAQLGGPTAAWERIDNVFVELLDGERQMLECEQHELALATIAELYLLVGDPILREGLNARLVELDGEGPYHACFYRLGALRLIEAPANLIEFDD